MTRSNNTPPWHPLGDADDHYWLVQRMAKRCGADLAQAAEDGAITQAVWAEMVQKCRGCTWVEGCQRWLNRLDEDGSVTPPERCLNASRLKAITPKEQGT